MKQSAQDDSSLTLDVNAMSAVPEYHEDPVHPDDWNVSNSLTLYLYGGPQLVEDTVRGRSRD